MKPEDAEELTQAVAQSVSGAWRTIVAYRRLGVPKALGLSTEQWVQERLGGYVKLSVAERRQAVAELDADGETSRGIEEVLGVSDTTVLRDLHTASNEAGSATKPQAHEVSPASNEAVPLDQAPVAAPTLTEQVETLRAATEHLDHIRTLQRDQPERFAADEIYDSLVAEFDHLHTWLPRLSPEHPGRSGPAEWQELLQRLHLLTAELASWYTESFTEASHDQHERDRQATV